MNWILLIFLLWLLYHFARIVLRELLRLLRYVSGKIPRSLARLYGRANSQAAWLALAHPLFVAQEDLALLVQPRALGKAPTNDARLLALRPLLLQYFGLRSTIGAADIAPRIETILHQRWYRLDMEQLGPQDDLPDALALACARLAFAVRAATLLGWVTPAMHWQVLQWNARRASDCFDSWHEYGAAYARGRRQWIIRNRSESFAVDCSTEQLELWIKSRLHPWRHFRWALLQQAVHTNNHAVCAQQ